MPNTKDQAADRFDAMTPVQFKTFEDRMRRMAKRQGLVLVKSRRRDPRAYDYGGYMIADEQNWVVAGGSPNSYGMDLDEVETFLVHPAKPARGTR